MQHEKIILNGKIVRIYKNQYQRGYEGTSYVVDGLSKGLFFTKETPLKKQAQQMFLYTKDPEFYLKHLEENNNEINLKSSPGIREQMEQSSALQYKGFSRKELEDILKKL